MQRTQVYVSMQKSALYIWVIPPSHSKNLLALVKVQILELSGRVLPKSRRSWGFPNFHGFWAAPGAIWSRMDGSKQGTDSSKKIDGSS